MTKAYYNEIDPYAAQWLRNLIKEGHIADGIVDERSIEDVTPADLKGFTQCHFFAGIGLWSLAARRAGWPDDRPMWSGSCPCQPFSAAGEGKGFADERHLWPAWNHLIGECRPVRIFGEQVASKDGLGWLDLVSADLEGQGYSVGAFDLCAAGFGAFHIRQRLYFTGVADTDNAGPQGWGVLRERGGQRAVGAGGLDGHGLADADSGQRNGVTATTGRHQFNGPQTGRNQGDCEPEPDCGTFWLEHASGLGRIERGAESGGRGVVGGCGTSGMANTGAEREQRSGELGLHEVCWLPCRDGKYRPTQLGLFPLADVDPGRVGKLRAYGNAIHVETATGFVRACMCP